eukprot:UN25652
MDRFLILQSYPWWECYQKADYFEGTKTEWVKHLKNSIKTSLQLLKRALKSFNINTSKYEDLLSVNFLSRILGCFHQNGIGVTRENIWCNYLKRVKEKEENKPQDVVLWNLQFGYNEKYVLKKLFGDLKLTVLQSLIRSIIIRFPTKKMADKMIKKLNSTPFQGIHVGLRYVDDHLNNIDVADYEVASKKRSNRKPKKLYNKDKDVSNNTPPNIWKDKLHPKITDIYNTILSELEYEECDSGPEEEEDGVKDKIEY